MLRFMLADGSSARAVQAEAARALGDLCLVRAPGEVDAAGAEMLGLLVEEGGRAGAGGVEKTTGEERGERVVMSTWSNMDVSV